MIPVAINCSCALPLTTSANIAAPSPAIPGENATPEQSSEMANWDITGKLMPHFVDPARDVVISSVPATKTTVPILK